MNTKRRKLRFSFMWDGVIHLADGSQWRVPDPARRADVIWWQSGEPIAIARFRGALVLRNPLRGETVPIQSANERMLELAA